MRGSAAVSRANGSILSAPRFRAACTSLAEKVWKLSKSHRTVAAQHAYPYLARRRGCMIHVASDAGIWGEQATGLYSVTKAAVVMLGKMLALDGGPDGVRSNVLCPGDIWPGMRHMAPPGQPDRGEGQGDWPVPPIGRPGQASDVAAAAVFYASDQAGFITGTTLLVDGGMTAGYLQRERGTQ